MTTDGRITRLRTENIQLREEIERLRRIDYEEIERVAKLEAKIDQLKAALRHVCAGCSSLASIADAVYAARAALEGK